ncbi:hypothetical protein ElyMa_005494500 [Elysia marginata]|uniref:Uncharacterized protein n=1 Tax=Elysia marginata TaxID=1093978 RepID=A0AAV4ET61_9GAST|nr:hypothetical protein ElyMa_005494500 [Elysia marginata]
MSSRYYRVLLYHQFIPACPDEAHVATTPCNDAATGRPATKISSRLNILVCRWCIGAPAQPVYIEWSTSVPLADQETRNPFTLNGPPVYHEFRHRCKSPLRVEEPRQRYILPTWAKLTQVGIASCMPALTHAARGLAFNR